MSYPRTAHFAGGLALFLSSLMAQPAAAAEMPMSPHEAAMRGLEPVYHGPTFVRSPAETTRTDTTFERMVMGYYSSFHGYPSSMIPYEHLTHLAWFAMDIDGSGNITSTNGWGGSTTAEIVSTAHSNGVKVLVTAAEFDDATICTLLNSSTNRSRLISNLVAQVQAGGGDGIALDLELPTSSCMAGFEQLTKDLASALHAANPGYHLSLALPPVDWSKVFHYDVLAAAADSLFIMGYNFHYSTGAPGPNDPLYASSTWGSYCLDWTVKDYLSKAGAYADKLILGLPLYGYDWPTTSASVPGTSTGTAKSVKWKEAQDGGATYGSNFDAASDSRYYVYSSSGTHQVWYDDVAAMEDRFAYINTKDLGGVGFWAVGFDQLDPELWGAVDEAFGSTEAPPIGDLVGYIREDDIYTGAAIANALVALSSGETTVTNSSGYYQFFSLPANTTYTVTASANCFTTVSDTKYVEEGITNWKSIALTATTCGGDGSSGCSERMAGGQMAGGQMTDDARRDVAGAFVWGAAIGLLAYRRSRRR